MQHLWKTHPWTPGQTLDLGEHEHAFWHESGLTSRPAHSVPPAVLDWLRWKYRRLQIDRRRDDEWHRVLTVDLPARIEAAGPRPDDCFELIECARAAAMPLWRADDAVSAFSKRSRLDQPKAPKLERVPKMAVQRDLLTEEMEELAMIVAKHQSTLAPLFAKCASAADQRAVVVAFRDLLNHPDSRSMRERWAHTLRVLGLV